VTLSTGVTVVGLLSLLLLLLSLGGGELLKERSAIGFRRKGRERTYVVGQAALVGLVEEVVRVLLTCRFVNVQ
jgi:hypothetical protein